LTLDREAAFQEFERRKRLYARANKRIGEILEALLDDLSARYGVREGLMVVGEPKPFASFYRKASDKYACETVDEAFERVRDLSRVRVLCHTLDDCYRLIALLDAQHAMHVVESSVEDRIKNPSERGYRAIHLEVRVDVPQGTETVGVPVEVQIRTTLQEAWGHYTHGDFYKADEVPHPVGRLMRELSDLLYWADRHAALLVDMIATNSAPEGSIPAAEPAQRAVDASRTGAEAGADEEQARAGHDPPVLG
jgi:ppGpp synthetase/RelA/SpoT-type nucleotidyltranferase